MIVVHGGAGVWRTERKNLGLRGVKEATKTGFGILKSNDSALDAVEAAVAQMEDNEVFNAGLGSALTIDKRIEMEASIMDGKTLDAGATGLLSDIKNPVCLARIVMESTDHVFVVADGAEKLADLFGVERRNPLTELRTRYWRDLKERLMRKKLDYLPNLHKLVSSNSQLFEPSTVGAVALDKDGNVAAATSTGGFSLKFPGRIGDSPLIGCGTYADNEAGACSTTGIGEIAIKLVLAKATCDSMCSGKSAQEAAESSIRLVNRRMHSGSMGLIAVDMLGRIGAAHNSPNLCWAYMTMKTHQPKAGLKAKIVKEAA
ncbi:isoaspartyl peptidase/L-asparaginase [Candidatus Bathyarchaeota archaeon]|nr:isoaspartyl peptidase/L-asparaginase [Candidatus Bathyarchaeota archaeon]